MKVLWFLASQEVKCSEVDHFWDMPMKFNQVCVCGKAINKEKIRINKLLLSKQKQLPSK